MFFICIRAIANAMGSVGLKSKKGQLMLVDLFDTLLVADIFKPIIKGFYIFFRS